MKRFALALVSVCCVCAAARASAGTGFESVGVSAGVVSAQDIDMEDTLGYTAWLGMTTPTDQVDMRLFVDYWRKSIQVVPNTPEASLRDLSFGVLGMHVFKVGGGTFRPYLGGGVGIHSIRSENPGVIFPVREDTLLEVGIQVGGGIGLRVNEAVDVIVEGWYIFVSPTDQLIGRIGAAFLFGTL